MAPLTIDRVKELHEAAKYAKTHGSGNVTLPADDLLTLLPAEPVDVTPEIPASAMQNETVHVFAEPVASASPDLNAEQIAEEIHEKTGAKTEVVNGVPIVHVPQVAEHGPVLVADPVEEVKTTDAEPERGHVEDGI